MEVMKHITTNIFETTIFFIKFDILVYILQCLYCTINKNKKIHHFTTGNYIMLFYHNIF